MAACCWSCTACALLLPDLSLTDMFASVCMSAAVAGVKRAHLVDARLDGGMLLELYSRDGVGTMISTDFYEGIRRAASRDLEAIAVSQSWYSYSYSNWLGKAEQPTKEPKAHGVTATMHALCCAASTARTN
jgi:hypothetical protein